MLLSLSVPVELPKHNTLYIIDSEAQGVCDEYLKSTSGCCLIEQDKGIFARYEPRCLSRDAAGWALRCNTEDIPSLPVVQISLTKSIFQQPINVFRNASRIHLSALVCFFLFHELLSSKCWAVILVAEVYYRWWRTGHAGQQSRIAGTTACVAWQACPAVARRCKDPRKEKICSWLRN